MLPFHRMTTSSENVETMVMEIDVCLPKEGLPRYLHDFSGSTRVIVSGNFVNPWDWAPEMLSWKQLCVQGLRVYASASCLWAIFSNSSYMGVEPSTA